MLRRADNERRELRARSVNGGLGVRGGRGSRDELTLRFLADVTAVTPRGLRGDGADVPLGVRGERE